MAKYNVDYSCGHGGMVQLFGKERDRERELEWLETCLCPECLEKQRAEEQKELLNGLAERGIELPELTGSEKQIKWAETIRASRLDNHIQGSKKIKEFIKTFNEKKERRLEQISPDKKDEFNKWADKVITDREEYLEIHEQWMTETYAGWFIERRTL